jgi:hypothetical protein
MNARRSGLAAFAVLGLVLLWWWVPGAPRHSRAPVPNDWVLPDAPPPPLDEATRLLARRQVWGQVKAPEAPAEPPFKSWRLVGTARNREGAYLLVSFDGKDPETRQVGDLLPGDNRILRIAEDHICVLVAGKERKLAVRAE